MNTGAPVLDPETTKVPPQHVSAGGGLGAQAKPWAAMGALVVAAGAARLAVHATGHEREVALFVGATAFVVAVVASMRSGRRTMDRRLRHRLVAALYLGASWLTMVTYHGVTWGAVAALTILGAGLASLYWQGNRTYGPSAPAAAPMPVVQEGDLYVERWADNLGKLGRVLAGSRLTRPEVIKAGYRYTLALVPGIHTVGQVRAMSETLRSGLGLLPGQEVIVEVHPDLPAPSAVVTIVTRSEVTTRTQVWPGPDAGFDSARGAVNLGPFVDNEGVGQWSVYRENGIFGGYLQGAPGSGKSRMIESIAMSVGSSRTHPTIIWYGDGQNGDSSPLLVKHADYAATNFDAIRNMLVAAVQVMRVNGIENRVAGRVGFTPALDRPGLLVIIDESHKVFDPAQNPHAAECQRLAATIAREGRKVGVGLIMASQSPTLDAFGGAGNSADTLRSSLLAGNGVILRSETQNAKMVFNVEVSPRAFPKVPGYAYLARPEEGARSAPFRGFHVTDEMALIWPERIEWLTLTGRQKNIAGKHYANRREVAAKQAEADELLLQWLDSGMIDDFEELESKVAVQPDGQGFGDGMPGFAPVDKFWEAPGYGLKAGQKKLLDAIRSGVSSPTELTEATGYSRAQVYNLLDELQATGHVRRVVREGGKLGWYEATERAA